MTVSPILRSPDSLTVFPETGQIALRSAGEGAWENDGLSISTRLEAGPDAPRLHIGLQSEIPVRALRLRWLGGFGRGVLYLGDAWERGYGDLEWRGLVPERVMPWYFLAFDGEHTAGFGMETGPNALCHWKVDAEGITLHLDVQNGSSALQLGDRILHVATVRGVEGVGPFPTAQALCKALCPQPRLPRQPVYGGNDWYYAYGNNSRASILDAARIVGDLAPQNSNRPFMVIDDGWQACRHPWNGGPWNQASPRFGDMAELAREIKALGVRPGIWFRPLLSALNLPASWRFAPRAVAAPNDLPLDPSVPEVLALVAEDVRRFREWGYELVKHDFSTFDIFWKWGFDLGENPALPTHREGQPWSFADKTRTTAEIIKAFYQTLREAAGEEMLVMGCNTIGHLGAGLFDIQRTGDDTSGQEWERTRKMGINTLAFRMAQHNTFFAVDADCVGLTKDIPWTLNRQWLDLLAHSGTPLFVSADPAVLGSEQQKALREAFAVSSEPQAVAEPLDWLETTCPSVWRAEKGERTYRWS